jgi:hypothetical protein
MTWKGISLAQEGDAISAQPNRNRIRFFITTSGEGIGWLITFHNIPLPTPQNNQKGLGIFSIFTGKTGNGVKKEGWAFPLADLLEMDPTGEAG